MCRGNVLKKEKTTKEIHWMVVVTQLLYIRRPWCKVRDRLIGKIAQNLELLKVPDKIYIEVMAKVIAGIERQKEDRERLIDEALQIFLNYIRKKRKIGVHIFKRQNKTGGPQ